jgi:hypothetical protein
MDFLYQCYFFSTIMVDAYRVYITHSQHKGYKVGTKVEESPQIQVTNISLSDSTKDKWGKGNQIGKQLRATISLGEEGRGGILML